MGRLIFRSDPHNRALGSITWAVDSVRILRQSYGRLWGRKLMNYPALDYMPGNRAFYAVALKVETGSSLDQIVITQSTFTPWGKIDPLVRAGV